MSILDQIKAKKAEQYGAKPSPTSTPAITATNTTNASSANNTSNVPEQPELSQSSARSSEDTGGLGSLLSRRFVSANSSNLAGAIEAAKAASRTHEPNGTTGSRDIPANTLKPVEAIVTIAKTVNTEETNAAFLAARDKLKADIQFLRDNMNNVELIKDAVVAVFKQVKATPELQIVMETADFDITMAAFKKAYGWAARQRTEKRETKAAKGAMAADFSRMLKDQNFSLGD